MNRRRLLQGLSAAPLTLLARRAPAAERTKKDIEQIRSSWRELVPPDFEVPSRRDTVSRTEEQWRQQLGEERFEVLREEDTEPAFSSPLNEEKRPGVF